MLVMMLIGFVIGLMIGMCLVAYLVDRDFRIVAKEKEDDK